MKEIGKFLSDHRLNRWRRPIRSGLGGVARLGRRGRRGGCSGRWSWGRGRAPGGGSDGLSGVALGVFGARDADQTEQVAEGSDGGMHDYLLISLIFF